MNWKELAAEVTAVGAGGGSSEAITGVEYDSRRVRPGSVFVAMKGGSTDGNRYIEKARAAGALGVITDSAQSFDHLLVFAPELALLEVEHGRQALAEAAAAFFGHPERRLAATGITGTNGKTTTAYLIEALLNAAERKTVLVGTIEYHVAGEVRPSVHTTPESRDLYELMAEGIDRGATELVTEVSSHGLDQGRATGLNFDVAVFTNLTRDHLDYHQTMEKYFAAKRLLFDGTRYPAPRVAVINALDPKAEELAAAAAKAGAEVRTYGIGAGDWRAAKFELTPRPLSIGGCGAAVHGDCGLRAHRRRASQPDRAGPADDRADRRAGDYALRLRRGPRPHQATEDGPGRWQRQRLCGGHQRQSPHGRAAGDSSGD
jgi:UDP-N-acetylmuramoyl-L-alanyl-D-glutamate--2,6-diaminopimelate ligase